MSEGNEVGNTLGMKFVEIGPGDFPMGGDLQPLSMKLAVYKHRLNGDIDEYPRHRATLTAPIRMGTCQVTNKQYEQFDSGHRSFRGKLGFSSGDDEAVVYVSWEDATAFCRWLTEKEGLPYRLPTEAEWEYACRAGTKGPFSAGSELPEAFLRNPLESWMPDPSRDQRDESADLTVGRTPSNPYGLYDMHGNVEEWCLDWYGPYTEEVAEDPVGPGDGELKVTRGGSHATEPYYLRSANRMAALPNDSSWLIGFRVVIGEMPGGPPLAPAPPSNCISAVGQEIPRDIIEGPSGSEPYFAAPRQFEKVPAGCFGPMFSEHNHLPSVVECPNGDLLAVWFSCFRERGRELTLVGSRLRYGADEWDEASPFWDAADRNMTGSVLWREGDRIYLTGGLSAAATWGNMIIYLRYSDDSGATWSKPEIILPDHANGQILPINIVFRGATGSILLPCDDGAKSATVLLESKDNGANWRLTDGRIDGIHAAVAPLSDGRMLAFGRRKSDDPRPMPRSISDDRGANWTVTDSPFDAVSGGQRPVMLRLGEGPLVLFSFTKGMEVTDQSGKPFHARGLFAAVSYDDGVTWPVRRLMTDDGPGRDLEGGAWTGRFFMSKTHAEPRGYLTATQGANGLIHLLTSRNHYSFNLKWLETPAMGD
jgi:formylglycine-generating enzyme required for sulfatase activity